MSKQLLHAGVISGSILQKWVWVFLHSVHDRADPHGSHQRQTHTGLFIPWRIVFNTQA